MPCRGPTPEEARRMYKTQNYRESISKVATHVFAALKKEPPEAAIFRTGKGNPLKMTQSLCAFMKTLTEAELKVAFNPTLDGSREAEAWWLAHKQQDELDD